MADLGELVLRLNTDASGLERGLDSAEKKTEQSIKKMAKSARLSANQVALSFAAIGAAATAAGIAIYKSGAQSVGSLIAMSDQIGVAIEDLAGLRFAAQQMSGMAEGTFDVSLRRMVRRLSEAADGAGPAVNAIKSLGLEASALAKLSPDQQFHAIANAMSGIADQGTKMRATMAIFDTEGMPLVNTLSQGSDAIREMQDQAEQLGLTVSRLDAAKVDAANNAFAAAMQTSQAFSQQIAVQFAPVVQSLVDHFSELSSEMGGMGNIASDAFGMIIDGTGFVIDAIEGIKRVFTIVADGIIAGAGTVVSKIAGYVQFILEQWNKIPGIDLSETIASIERFKETASGVAGEAMDNIQETLNRPMPSEAFKQFVADAQAAGQAAAEAAVAAREAMGAGALGDGLSKGVEGAAAKTAEELAKLDTLRANAFAIGATEQEQLRAKLSEQRAIIAEAREAEAITQEEYDQRMLLAKDEYETSMTAIAEREASARLAAIGGALGNISSLMNSENRKQFEVGKAAALAQTAIATYTGSMEAYKAMAGIPIVGPALGIAAAGAVGLAGAMNMKNISSTKFGGGSAAVSNTQAINNQATGTGQQGGQNHYIHGIERGSFYDGGTILDVLNRTLSDGGRLVGVM